jgi:hypothetical protein
MKRIVRIVPQFCTEARKNKGFIIPLERTTRRTAKANGKSERAVKNIRMNFTGPELSEGNVLMPGRIQNRIKEAH